MITAGLLTIVITLMLFAFLKVRQKYQIFKKWNIKHQKPAFIIRSSLETLLGRKHISELIEEEYNSFPGEDVIGNFQFTNAQLIICNPELIEDILIKDFSHFCDRMMNLGEIKDPVAANLLFLTGNIWRAVRYKLSPLFTTGKLKFMYESIKDCGSNLRSVLDEKKGKEVNLQDIMSSFALDVIGSCAFGIEPESLMKPDSKYRKLALKLFAPTPLLMTLKFLFFSISPTLFKKLKLHFSFAPKDSTDFLCGVISDSLDRRQKEGTKRNDFVQMLLQLKEKGKIDITVHDKSDDYLLMDSVKDDTYELKLTDNILIGGAFSFLFAGFHATAMTLTFSLLELVRNPEVLRQVKEEIQSLEITEGDIAYDQLKKLTYLDNVIKEVLRLYPTVAVLSRICTKDYTLRTGLEVKKGTNIIIPVSSLHRDPAYFQDPDTFNPDRFNTEPTPGTYLPFGDGPRICIAMRFAMLEMKFALVEILMNYDISLSDQTVLPLKFNPKIFLTTPLNPIIFKFKRISN